MNLAAPRNILMATPKGFRIAYGINPHMFDEHGNLKSVDPAKALAQWKALHDLYETLGLTIHTIEGRDEFPDLVFSANPTFPFVKDGKPGVVLANMHSEFRREEAKIYAEWARMKGLGVHTIEGGCFEGSGDAIWNYETGEIFGAHGIRTELSVYDHLERITGAKVHRLKLVDTRFYHLDTCLVVLNATTAAYVPRAFDEQGRRTLGTLFETLITIDQKEALQGFAGNAFCPDGKNVVIQARNTNFTNSLRNRGFHVHEMETGEFIKSGGSVFCTKQHLWL